MRTNAVKLSCACGCGIEFFVSMRSAYRFKTGRYAFFSAGCESMPEIRPTKLLKNAVVFAYAKEYQDDYVAS